jgi:hypothetical protein
MPGTNALDPDDYLDDPDWDGINFSLMRDQNGFPIISQGDYNHDGVIDPVLENETFCNLEEYLFGIDIDRDGINDISPDPNDWDTDGDGIPDGWEALLGDLDGDGMSNWWELVNGISPFDPEGIHGADGDIDDDGWTNLQEYLNQTNPRDPESRPDGPPGLMGDAGLLWEMFWEADRSRNI